MNLPGHLMSWTDIQKDRCTNSTITYTLKGLLFIFLKKRDESSDMSFSLVLDRWRKILVARASLQAHGGTNLQLLCVMCLQIKVLKDVYLQGETLDWWLERQWWAYQKRGREGQTKQAARHALLRWYPTKQAYYHPNLAFLSRTLASWQSATCPHPGLPLALIAGWWWEFSKWVH